MVAESALAAMVLLVDEWMSVLELLGWNDREETIEKRGVRDDGREANDFVRKDMINIVVIRSDEVGTFGEN